MISRHHRAIIRIRISRRAHLERFDTRDQLVHQPVGRVLAHRHGHGDRHAALTSGPVACADQIVHNAVEIRIRQDDGVVLGPAHGLHALAVGGTRCIDVFSRGGRTDKADGLDARVRQQRVHGGLGPVDHIEHACGRACFHHQLRQAQRH